MEPYRQVDPETGVPRLFDLRSGKRFVSLPSHIGQRSKLALRQGGEQRGISALDSLVVLVGDHHDVERRVLADEAGVVVL